MLILTVELQFGGPFLVNDPCSKRSDKDPDHSPRLTSDRRPLLPASSFRGAFRSQAERILRTLDSNALGDPHRLGWDPKTKMPPPLFELFGYSKRRALVDIEDFTGTEPVSKELLEQHTQQFVAIDRFTGGSSHRRLFNAAYLDRPTLTGKIRIPLDGRVRPEMLGLLALTFRDLIEGDITFGWGAAKGYGVCRARIAKWEVIGAGRLSLARLQTLCKGIDTQQAAQLKSQLQENNFVLTEPVKCLVSTLVKCLQVAMGPAEG
jgi:CRISPR/Cas system CSM-associated protein Csm3 (group 7 of RAMP superfamily)